VSANNGGVRTFRRQAIVRSFYSDPPMALVELTRRLFGLATDQDRDKRESVDASAASVENHAA
jgi:hypothetical protein